MKKTFIFFAIFTLSQYTLLAFGNEHERSLQMVVIGGKELGMGGASVAISDAATAAYSNPAGLGQIRTNQFATLRRSKVGVETQGVEHRFINYVYPRHKLGTFAIGIVHLGFYGGKQASQVEKMILGSAKDKNRALLISYGREILTNELFGGLNLRIVWIRPKGIWRDILGATGVGVDIGLICCPVKWLQLGLKETINSGNLGETLPETAARAGMVCYLGDGTFAVACDINQEKHKSLSTDFGMEYRLLTTPPGFSNRFFFKKASFRAGINRLYLEKRSNDGQDDGHINFTLGLGNSVCFYNRIITIDAAVGFFKDYSERRLTLTME